MATYWENSCSFGLRYVSWYKYLIVSLVFSHLGFWSGNLFLIAPFPDLCLLVPFCGVSLGRENEILYKWSRSHDQDGRHGYEYQKRLKIFFFRTRRSMILKLGKKHLGIELYKNFINHDPGMTLTYFTARST